MVADPNLGFVLVAAGALGVYAGFCSLRMIVAGVGGGIAAILGLSSLAALPINPAAAALLLAGMALLLLGAKLAAAGACGTMSIVYGATRLIDGPAQMGIHWPTALAAGIPFALTTIFLARLAVRARANKAVY